MFQFDAGTAPKLNMRDEKRYRLEGSAQCTSMTPNIFPTSKPVFISCAGRYRGFEWMRRERLLDPRRRFELIDGLVLHRSDHSQRHDRVIAELARRLAEAVVDEQLEVAVDRELSFETLDAVVTPDIVVSGGVEVPSLIVEVSDHAPRVDGMEKARLYARAGVEQYWHIDLAWTMLDVHRHPHEDGYGMRAGGPPREACPTFFAALPGLCLVELLEASDAAA